MSEHFERALAAVLKHEGGYVDNPADPGGRTIYGITERDHPDLWKAGTPTIEQAAARYLRDYWGPAQCEGLPYGVALCLFDCAVNQGPGTAAKLLQQAAGVTADGKIGAMTRAAIAKNPQAVILKMQELRIRKYAKLQTWPTFGEGWTIRALRVLAEALSSK